MCLTMFKLSTFLGHSFLPVCGSRLFHDKGAQYMLHQRHYCRDLRNYTLYMEWTQIAICGIILK